MEEEKIPPTQRPNLPPRRPPPARAVFSNTQLDAEQQFENQQPTSHQEIPALQIKAKEKGKKQKQKRTTTKLAKQNDTEKSKKIGKKAIFITVLICVLVLTVAISVYFIVDSVNKNKKLDIGGARLYVHEVSNKVYLQAEQKPCQKYVFEIFDGSNTSIVKSTSSLFDVTNLLQEGKSYSFKFYIEGATEKTRSSGSASQNFVLQSRLTTPNVRLSADGKSLVWEKVSNAQNYEIVYYNKTTSVVSTIPVSNSANGLISIQPNLREGEYYLQVLAKTNILGYTNSQLSAPIKYVVKNVENTPTDLQVNREDCLLNITLPTAEISPTFVIKIGEEIFEYKTVITDFYFSVSLKTFMNQIPLGKTASVAVKGRNQMYTNSAFCIE